MDWWYACVYPGHADLMDEASRVFVPWLEEQASRERADRWFFIRYWDSSGHHLRLRLRCSADGVDRLYDRTPEIVGLLASLGGPAPHDRLLPAAAITGRRGKRIVRTRLYAPEVARYGGPQGVDLAEGLFTTSSSWYAADGLGALAPRFDRAALAVEYMSSLVRTALPAAGQREFWAAHQRHWGWHLQLVVREREVLRALVDRVRAGVAESGSERVDLLPGIDHHVGTVLRTLDRAEAAGVTVPRPQLLLYYLHMDLNRWGFVPAEETLLGIVAASRQRP